MDERLERHCPSTTTESAAMVEQICAASRLENRAAAAQLVAIGGLFGYRLSRCSDTEDWAIDTMEAVTAEVAAALRISQGLAASRLRYARAMRERLPAVGAVFAAGDIDYPTFQTIVFRTDLIADPAVLARVDAVLAANVARWPSTTRARLSGRVDTIVVTADRDAVRRRTQRRVGREVYLGEPFDGLCELSGSLLQPDAQALDARLTSLAATVCPHDPRTRDQRRADGLIAAELIAELAATSTLVPLIHPEDSPPEPHYTPSPALADFVRCRDLTCRWPGCDRPARYCDLDHTIPYRQGGPTHAANLKCLCRLHHLVKTFWGWREQQLTDGTLILTSPAGHTHLSTPGSALPFPSLCTPATGMPAQHHPSPRHPHSERTTMMPKRRRTRTQDRQYRVATERNHNRQRRQATHQAAQQAARPQPSPDDDPPPF